MGKFILRSKAVFTGLEDFPRPAAIAVDGQKDPGSSSLGLSREIRIMQTGLFTITEKK